MMISRPCLVLPGRSTPGHSLVVAAILGLCMLASPGAQETREWSDTSVRPLVEGARSALSLGYRAAAVELLDEVLSLAPSNSDAAYLRALLAQGDGEPGVLVERFLSSALSSDAFSLYDRTDAELLLAGILVRTGRPGQALRFLAGMPRDAEPLYLESLAKRALGDRAGSRAAVMESMRRFPSDPRPLLSWLLYGAPDPADIEDSALVRKAFVVLPGLKEMDPDLLIALAPYAPDAEEARLLVREYRSANRLSPNSTVLAFSYGLIDVNKATDELFSGNIAPDAADLRSLYALLPDTVARDRFISGFSTYTGLVTCDDSGDGIPEATSLYRSGTLVSWVYDGDQDGQPERMATMKESAPTEIRIRSGSAELVLRYDPWPYVKTATFPEELRERVYRFADGVLALPLIRLEYLPELARGPRLATVGAINPPTERALASLAWLVEERTPELSTVAALDGARVTRAWWQDSFGVRGVATYREGVPSDERLDTDGDGRFESRRVWGRLPDGSTEALYVESDLDGDGLWEYRETIMPPYAKSWDLDTDGAPDLFMEKPSRDVEIFRFMPSWKKRLPLTVRIEKGMPVSSTLGAVDRPFIPDSGGRVTWIGSKPFDFGSIAPGTGFGVRGGVRYAVTDIGGRLYAEILD